MNSQSVIFVVLAYGLWGVSTRSPRETVGYGMYLNECAKALRNLVQCGNNVTVCLCGGAEWEGTTEAETLLTYFKQNLDAFDQIVFRLEDRSLTTPANIWQAYGKIEDELKWPDVKERRMIFVCDKAREIKVRWIVKLWRNLARRDMDYSGWNARRVILSWPEPEVVAFDRPDVTWKSTWLVQFIDLMAMMFVPRYLKRQINKLREE